MNKYIENQNDLLYYTDLELCLSLVKGWLKDRPNNKELQELSKALVSISFYVNKLTLDRYSYNRIISDARQEKNQAMLKVKDLHEELVKLKKLEKAKTLAENYRWNDFLHSLLEILQSSITSDDGVGPNNGR